MINTANPNLARTALLLNRAVAIDSAAAPRVALVCRACEALGVLASHAAWADSTTLAERTVRRWIALQPANYAGWVSLTDLALALGHEREAVRADHVADSLGRPVGSPSLRDMSWQLRADKLDLVDARCRRELPTAPAAVFGELRWWCTIALRMQGRYYREALRLARAGVIPGAATARPEIGVEPIQSAGLDFEMYRPLAAGFQFRRFAEEARSQSLPGAGGPPDGVEPDVGGDRTRHQPRHRRGTSACGFG